MFNDYAQLQIHKCSLFFFLFALRYALCIPTIKLIIIKSQARIKLYNLGHNL